MSKLCFHEIDSLCINLRNKKDIFHGNGLYKPYKQWLKEFMRSFERYGNSVYENVRCDLDDLNPLIYEIALVTENKEDIYRAYNDGETIEYIIWDFDNDCFVYIDSFGDPVIYTNGLEDFFNELEKLHPAIKIPSVMKVKPKC